MILFLQSMEDDCGFYESKLQSMRVLAEELSPIGNEHAKLAFQASITLMANELSAIHSRCQDIKVSKQWLCCVSLRRCEI